MPVGAAQFRPYFYRPCSLCVFHLLHLLAAMRLATTLTHNDGPLHCSVWTCHQQNFNRPYFQIIANTSVLGFLRRRTVIRSNLNWWQWWAERFSLKFRRWEVYINSLTKHWRPLITIVTNCFLMGHSVCGCSCLVSSTFSVVRNTRWHTEGLWRFHVVFLLFFFCFSFRFNSTETCVYFRLIIPFLECRL